MDTKKFKPSVENSDQILAREHLANERTFLAWVRTGIAIIAFGFVVVKSSMFVDDSASSVREGIIPGELFTAIVGIALVVAGTFISTGSYMRYRETKKQLRKGNYHHSSKMLSAITIGVLLVSALLIVYLLRTL